MKQGIKIPKFLTIECLDGGWVVSGNDFRKVYIEWYQLKVFIESYLTKGESQ